MNLATKTSLLITFLTMTSCGNFTKNLSTVEIEKNIDLTEQENQALATNNFQKGFWPEEDWWEMFQDEQLSSFIKTGISGSPSLKTAEARVRQANQEAFVVRSKLYPDVGGVFNYIYSLLSEKGIKKQLRGVDSTFQLFALMLDFSYEFDFWGKNRNVFEAAIGTMHTKEALSQQTKMILTVAIAKQYYDIQSNMSKMVVLQELLENKSKYYRLTELRRINRIDNILDVNGVKQEILTLQEVLAALEGELKLQKSMLITLLGQNPADDLKINVEWEVPNRPFEMPDDIGLGLLSRRPDLISHVWKIYSMTKQMGGAMGEFFPNVTLGAVGGTDAISIQDLFSSQSGSVTTLPKINIPLFTGGRLKANLRAKVAAYEEAVYEYNELLLKATNEVVSGITNLNTMSERFKYQNDEVISKRENYDLVYSRYKHGIDSMMSVLSSDDQYLRARYNQIKLVRDRIESTIELVRALGGGYFSQIDEQKNPIITTEEKDGTKADICGR